MPHKILVVDDEPDVLESTALLAESLGYQAVRLGQADAIFETVLRERPDAILQDLKMPGLNLAGLVAALRSGPETADIPLVFYGAGRDLGATATRYDAWGYLSKPFGRGDLHRLLGQIFDHPGRSGRNVEREVKGLFHEILDHVTAAHNYLRVLELGPEMPPERQRAVRGAGESLLKLEVKINGLRTYVMGLAAAIEPVPHWPGEPPKPPAAGAPAGRPEEGPEESGGPVVAGGGPGPGPTRQAAGGRTGSSGRRR